MSGRRGDDRAPIALAWPTRSTPVARVSRPARAGAALAALLAAALVVCADVRAAGEAPAAPPDTGLAHYRPPALATRSGATRVLSSRTRGEADESLSIAVIAPDHVGLTTRSQPTLYWFAAGRIDGAVEITIQDEDGAQPLVEARRELSDARGLLAVRLDELGVQLKPGAEYRWSVAVVRDPAARSRDLVTSGAIMRVPPLTGTSATLAGVPAPTAGASATSAGTADEVASLAQAGLWYDAIERVGATLARQPQDPVARRQRATLLEQVGLAEAAAADRALLAPR